MNRREEKDAVTVAQKTVNTHYEAFPLRFSLSKPIRFPHGWRFPFEVYPDDYNRLRSGRLILFVSDDAAIEESEIESDNCDDKLQSSIGNLSNDLRNARLPDIHMAIRYLQAKIKALHANQEDLADAMVAAWESVIDPDYKDMHKLRYPLCWRMIALTPDRTYKAYVGFKPMEQNFDEQFKRHIYQQDQNMLAASVEEQQLFHAGRFGRITLPDRVSMTIDFRIPKQSKCIIETLLKEERLNLLHMRSDVIASACLAHVNFRLAQLGFQTMDRNAVQFYHYQPTVDQDIACMAEIGKSALIKLPFLGNKVVSQAEDPSIVFHELGHALRYLSFCGLPDNCDDKTTNADGVEEGFCDYFAATMLADVLDDDGQKIILKVGEGLGRPYRKVVSSLPRTVNGRAPAATRILKAGDSRYGIGLQWANLLWDLRAQIAQGSTTDLADQTIICAHLKPTVASKLPSVTDARLAYFESLQRTYDEFSARQSSPSPVIRWDKLKRRHKLA